MMRQGAVAAHATGRALAAVVAVIGLPGCAATSPIAAPPMWERPGLRGAVRPEMGAPQPGDAAPDFELPVLAGGVVRLSSLRGSWIVLHFTATWCPYCDAEMAHLGELAAAYASSNVKVLVVDLEEDPEVWSAYAQQRVSPGLVALQDRTGDAAKRFAPPRAQPSFTDRAQVLFDSTLVIDPQGIIRVFLLPDTAHFDPTFQGVRKELDRQRRSFTDAPDAPIDRPAADLLPADQVVDISAAVRAPDASGGQLVVRLAIAPGYHIMSDRPPGPFSIPTKVGATAGGFAFEAPAYPAARSLGPILVFDGTPEVVLPFRREGKGATGPIAVEVRYQACTETQCLSPVRKHLDVAAP